MKYFLQLLCFAFMFGIFLAYDEWILFLPQPRLPPPKCPLNEVFKICLTECSNCEQRGYCAIRDCKTNGCDCIPQFMRLTPGSPCEPVSKCPQPRCGENEVFRECGPACERCGIFDCRMVYCEHRCYCKEGFKRDAEGKCIPEEECEQRTPCAYGEEWRDSGPEEEYCLHEEGEIVSNNTVNIPRCYCMEGFKRNGYGRCIEEQYCHAVVCMGTEKYQNCPKKCNVTCRTYGDSDCVEDDQCYPGCFCPEGFMMNDYRVCVPLEGCPPDSNPFVPTFPPPVETTIPASVDEDLKPEETTAPATGEASENQESAVAIAVAESGVDVELPENLHGEDVETGETDAGTPTDATYSPRRKSSERPKNRSKGPTTSDEASVEAEVEAALDAIREAGGDQKE